LFTASDLPLTSVDFSHNRIRRLTERTFDGVEDTLEEVHLGHNLLGDNLDPTFITDEFKKLTKLRTLDLSHNELTQVDEDLLQGCKDLKVS
jgi:Leucine-rich repeat (LRR) protein